MRRLLGAVAAACIVWATIPAPPATAQESAVTLRLVAQSPWVPGYHRGILELKLLAFNGGATALSDLTMQVSFGPHLATQSSFDTMVSTGVPFSIAETSKSVNRAIDAGGSLKLEMNVHLETLDTLDQTDSQVYPTAVQLLSSGTVVATLVTPVIYFPQQEPAQPMRSSVSVELSAPIAFGADGTLTDPSFPASLADGGTLRAPLDAVTQLVGGRHPSGAFDLVVDPLAITQARDVADGYRSADGTEVAQGDPAAVAAEGFVKQLARTITHRDTVETVAQPYGDPVLPAMVASPPLGLQPQLTAARLAGATVVGSLGTLPTMTVAQPEGGRLSDNALAWLADVHTSVILADAGTVDRSPWQDEIAPSPTVPVATAPDMTMVLPDPATQALFARTDLLTDPVRSAQLVLGQLALIWKQQPVPPSPTVRGIAIAPPPTVPPDLWAPLLQRLAEAPFLKPLTATRLVDVVHPTNPNGTAPLAAPDESSFESTYAADIQRLTGNIEAYASMLPSESADIPTELRRRLFVATAPPYLDDPDAGRPWLASVEAATQGAFDTMAPTVSQQFTFSSREGTIPVLMGNPGELPLRVTIELDSPNFTFPDGNARTDVVTGPGETWNFRVVAETSGQNPIYLMEKAPNGRPIYGPAAITVRSTAVNHIALLVTLGAALVLVALYARRWVRRRRNPV